VLLFLGADKDMLLLLLLLLLLLQRREREKPHGSYDTLGVM